MGGYHVIQAQGLLQGMERVVTAMMLADAIKFSREDGPPDVEKRGFLQHDYCTKVIPPAHAALSVYSQDNRSCAFSLESGCAMCAPYPSDDTANEVGVISHVRSGPMTYEQ